MKILGIIPARGGSKGVPRKNIHSVCGKPLIAYTIETALNCKDIFTDIIVSTDDPEIAGISERYGAQVPFLRPAELSGDKVPTLPVLQHAVNFMEAEKEITYDWVMLMQPTDPFRSEEDIRESIRLAEEGGCDSVISVVQVFAVHPILMKKIENGYLEPFCIEEKEGTRRQDYHPAAYMRNGAVYLSKRDCIINKNSIWGDKIKPYIMPPERSIGVDSELDMRLVEIIMEKNLNLSDK